MPLHMKKSPPFSAFAVKESYESGGQVMLLHRNKPKSVDKPVDGYPVGFPHIHRVIHKQNRGVGRSFPPFPQVFNNGYPRPWRKISGCGLNVNKL
ncbi:MAG: hypothetical protein PUK79_05115 [Clostridiales bacterium]|nr:hypothetical protein [Clostridiales bacterium]MDY2835483.1 hypothetical protein [Candidatus Aphodomonas sp.]